MFQMLTALFSLYIIYISLGSGVAANSELIGFLDTEAVLINQFELYLHKAQQQQDKLNRFLTYVEAVQMHAGEEDADEYFGNPLNAYGTISRLVNDWRHEVLAVIFNNTHFEQLTQQLGAKMERYKLDAPNSADLQAATASLMHFQNDNQLTTPQLANGAWDSDEALTTSECFIIAQNLGKLRQFDAAIEWLLLARIRAQQQTESFPYVNALDVQKQLVLACENVKNFKLANKFNNELLKAEPSNEFALKKKDELINKLMQERSFDDNIKIEL